jgi:hypothetical protein
MIMLLFTLFFMLYMLHSLLILIHIFESKSPTSTYVFLLGPSPQQAFEEMKNYLIMVTVLSPFCHTRVLGHQDPGANIITRCAGTKSHTYDESWHRIECHIFTI